MYGKGVIMNQSQLENMVKDILKNANFGNVARPKPNKASASSNSTQKTWGGKENARPSSSTQGSWDATNTPGGVSSFAKEVWTKDQIVALVREEVMRTMAFGNKPVPALVVLVAFQVVVPVVAAEAPGKQRSCNE